MEDARPAVDVAATRDLGHRWWVQADGAAGWLARAAVEGDLFDGLPLHDNVGVRQLFGVVAGRLDDELAAGKELGTVVER